ncbi:MAG: glutamine--fructose-6-phosphate transaminase (isomerizing) [Candidatus Micrarchaeota archaeon]
MCGIFGIIFERSRADLGKILIKGGKNLTYRGYDSVGCVTIDGSKADLRKDTGTIDEVTKKLRLTEMRGDRGICQLRWATFGAPSQVNAQPHFDSDKRIVGAHNGNIVNTIQLTEEFRKEGMRIVSTNDGETCMHAIEKHYKKTKNMKKSIMGAAKMLHGDYAYAVLHVDEKKLYCAKIGSSLYLGVGNDFICCSSDLPSILPFTNMIVLLRDGEFVEFTHNSYKIMNVETGEKIHRDAEKSQLTVESASKGGYPHFMLKEIREQPSRVGTLLKALDDSRYLDFFLDHMNGPDVYLVGSGSSYNACVSGAYYFNRLSKRKVVPVIAGQFEHLYGNVLSKDSVLVCVSQSGETKDLMNVVNYCRKHKKGRILGVINVLGSSLMNASEAYLPLACDLEMSVPATKTFTNQLVLLIYLAIRLGERNGELNKDEAKMLGKRLHDLPKLLEKTIEQTEPACKKLADDLYKKNDIYCLGYGMNHGIALEGALKIKEITYTHCEGIYSSEFKHGPLSIVEKGYPVIYVTSKEDSHMIISHMNEVACRHGRVICISEDYKPLHKNVHDYVVVPKDHELFAPVLNVVPVQLISYYWSVKKGIDPDYPRNLSKTITVD